MTFVNFKKGYVMLNTKKETLERVDTCTTHGEYISKKYWFIENFTKCSKCVDEQIELADKQKIQLEEANKKSQWENRLGVAALPIRFLDKSFDNYFCNDVDSSDYQKKALKASVKYANEFYKNKGQCLIMCGGVGTGKTHLAVSIALFLMENNHDFRVIFTTVQRFMRAVKDTWAKKNSRSETEVINDYAAADLLILDEVGVQFGSETEKQILFDLLNERYELRKKTIFISNFDADGVRSFLGDRVADRLKEDNATLIPFDFKSYRSN